MASTTIANLWTPAIWIPQVDEVTRTKPALITSRAVVQGGQFDEIASGGGTIANLPFFKDITDTAEGIQVELTAPSLNNHISGIQLCPILNREVAFAAGALASAITGPDADPVASITNQLGVARQKRMQVTLLNVLRGLFNFSAAPGGAAALSATRSDISIEAGASAVAANLISNSAFNSASALLAELQSNAIDGAIWCHPNIRAALLTQDANSFERLSRGDFMLETYKGIPLYVSNLLSRAGATTGTVYDTYIMAPRAIAIGMKPQTDSIDVASLQYYKRPDINDEQIYDRTRYVVHVAGTAYTASPAGQSATNAELAVAASWSLRYQTADRCGIVQLRTNG